MLCRNVTGLAALGLSKEGMGRFHEMCGAGVVCGPGLGSESFSPHGRLFHLGQPCQELISSYAFYGPFMVLVFLF